MSIKVRSVDITVNFLYCGHCGDLKLVFSLARVRDSKSFRRTFVICSCRGFRCCPYYWGVRKARVDCILFHLWINTKTIKRDKFTKENSWRKYVFSRLVSLYVNFSTKRNVLFVIPLIDTQKKQQWHSHPTQFHLEKNTVKFRKKALPCISPAKYKPPKPVTQKTLRSIAPPNISLKYKVKQKTTR